MHLQFTAYSFRGSLCIWVLIIITGLGILLLVCLQPSTKVIYEPVPKPQVYRTDLKIVPRTQVQNRTRLVYLVQTESCLPSYLQTHLVDEKDACNCDVIVLSYKRKCETPSTDVHYMYKSLPWSKGRNHLFFTAKASNVSYLYYIFLDDDVVLVHTNKTTSENPWRTFESFLRRITPAVAAVPMEQYPFLDYAYKMRKANPNCPRISPEDECLPTGRFDAIVNSFHYQAVDYILPYAPFYDHVSWYYPCSYVGIKCEVIFQGHSVLLTKLRAKNAKHRSYTRGKAKGKSLLRMLDFIESEFPEKYRNRSVLREWRVQGVEHEHISSSYCLPAPPAHKPIVPFEMFGDALS